MILIIPSINGKYDFNETVFEENFQISSSNLSIKIIRPKPGYLYIFDKIEIPISSNFPIIIGKITCVAEQMIVYPYTVKWEFIDWQNGNYKFPSDNYSSTFWNYTYSKFNFGVLLITASFESTLGNVMSSDLVIAKKFL
jgi:hypothetical protein